MIFLSLLSFAGCEGEWVASDTAKTSCDLSETPFTSGMALTLSSDGEVLYVLDRYYDVYRYARNDARVCAFDLDRTSDLSDAKISVDYAKDIAVAGSFLYYYDGIGVRRYNDPDWHCDYSMNFMAVTGSYVFGAPSSGINEYKITSSGCSIASDASFSAARVEAIAANSSIVAALETSGALTDPPERFSVYDKFSGALKVRSALSSDTSSSLHFCSASRLRLSNSYALLLDAECGYLGVFNYSSGMLEHKLNLSSIGIRSPVDIATVGDDLYILTGSSVVPLYLVDLASYSWEVDEEN